MSIEEAIKKHALEVFPEECVGFICNDQYHRLINTATNPTERYMLSTRDKIFLSGLGTLQGLVHSHPILDNTPSKVDLQAQQSTGFTFYIVGTDGHNTTEVREIIYEKSSST